MTAADWDREPTSHAERVPWRVISATPKRVVTYEVPWVYVGTFATPELAAAAVWAHNVMHAAREQRALGSVRREGEEDEAETVRWEADKAESKGAK